jgi:pimeloyl-ACP methyl ester carboxylesterase
MNPVWHTLSPGEPGAPLVVFVHGLESAWSSWLPIAVELDPRWRKVALELPWRPGNDYRWRYRTAGSWLGDSLDALGATPDLLVAHSYGANATLDLLCAGDPRPGPAAALVCPLYRLPKHAVTWQMFDRARGMFHEHMREGLSARLGTRAGNVRPDVLAAMVEVAIDRVGPLGFLTSFEKISASTHLPLDRVAARTLVVAGGADATLVPEAARTLAAAIPDCRVRITDEYDHFCHVRHAPGIAAQLAAFLGVTVPERTAEELL